ncbi:ATP-binding cassette domain-containing protein [Arcanobacterium wilhelmae]|uniref:ATP-binding cassette domain-containing protein n=1 Tax=Arcanobacterium wilhelmae TaxID=1803177 RepID=UPI002414FF13|nr:ATP-binding cassette domain-containing protein [Arcanobacterium wilhelmae]WFN90537.1 ATP-binding cassette domain-containing protein [Arcanobacterium wilhelmae]
MSNVITMENVTKIHRSGADEVRALDGVSAGIRTGEFVAVMGPSGSGKSTFLNVIGGLDAPTSGKIFVDGQEITAVSIKIPYYGGDCDCWRSGARGCLAGVHSRSCLGVPLECGCEDGGP